jgi:hypothetical protein
VNDARLVAALADMCTLVIRPATVNWGSTTRRWVMTRRRLETLRMVRKVGDRRALTERANPGCRPSSRLASNSTFIAEISASTASTSWPRRKQAATTGTSAAGTYRIPGRPCGVVR